MDNAENNDALLLEEFDTLPQREVDRINYEMAEICGGRSDLRALVSEALDRLQLETPMDRVLRRVSMIASSDGAVEEAMNFLPHSVAELRELEIGDVKAEGESLLLVRFAMLLAQGMTPQDARRAVQAV